VRLFLSRCDTDNTTYIQKDLEESGLYVIKILFQENRLDKRRSEQMGELFMRYQRGKTQRLIAPLVVGRIKRKDLNALLPVSSFRKISFLFEIQRYAGGDNMYDVIMYTRKSVRWSIHNVLTLWNSMMEILEIGVAMIEGGYLISDIKMDNMIIDESGMWMIDPEVYPQTVFTTMKNIVVTPNPMNMPAQFLNPHFFSPNPLRTYTLLYRRDWMKLKKFYQHTNSHRLDTLLDLTSKTVRYQNPALFIRHVAILGLFYPFLMIMIYIIDTKISIKQFSPESREIIQNINDLCYKILQTRASYNAHNMLQMMRLATTKNFRQTIASTKPSSSSIRDSISIVPPLALQSHTIIQDYIKKKKSGRSKDDGVLEEKASKNGSQDFSQHDCQKRGADHREVSECGAVGGRCGDQRYRLDRQYRRTHRVLAQDERQAGCGCPE